MNIKEFFLLESISKFNDFKEFVTIDDALPAEDDILQELKEVFLAAMDNYSEFVRMKKYLESNEHEIADEEIIDGEITAKEFKSGKYTAEVVLLIQFITVVGECNNLDEILPPFDINAINLRASIIDAMERFAQRNNDGVVEELIKNSDDYYYGQDLSALEGKLGVYYSIGNQFEFEDCESIEDEEIISSNNIGMFATHLCDPIFSKYVDSFIEKDGILYLQLNGSFTSVIRKIKVKKLIINSVKYNSVNLKNQKNMIQKRKTVRKRLILERTVP